MKYIRAYNTFRDDNFFNLFTGKNGNNLRATSALNLYRRNDYYILECGEFKIPIPQYMKADYLAKTISEVLGSEIPKFRDLCLPFMRNIRSDKERYIIDASTYEYFGAIPFLGDQKIYCIQQVVRQDMKDLMEVFFPNITTINRALILPKFSKVITSWGEEFLNKSIIPSLRDENDEWREEIYGKPLSYYIDRYNIPRVDYLNLRMYDGAFLSLCGSIDIINEFHPYIEVYLTDKAQKEMANVILSKFKYEIRTIGDVIYAS